MKSLLAFLTSLIFSFSNFTAPKPPTPPVFPTPIQFHQYPQSNITVNWNSPGPDFTIFMEPDMKPCDHLERSFSVSNLKSIIRPITIRGSKTTEAKNFSVILDIRIYKDNVLIYGPKKLSQFFIDSNQPAGVSLGNLAGNSTSTYKIVVDFPCSAGNEYQQAKLVFKLKIGKLLSLPQPCSCSCYQNHDGRYDLHTTDHNVFANFDEGDHITCLNRFNCASIAP